MDNLFDDFENLVASHLPRIVDFASSGPGLAMLLLKQVDHVDHETSGHRELSNNLIGHFGAKGACRVKVGEAQSDDRANRRVKFLFLPDVELLLHLFPEVLSNLFTDLDHVTCIVVMAGVVGVLLPV